MVTLLRFLFPTQSLSGRRGELVTAEERSALKLHPIFVSAGRVKSRGALSLACIAAAGSYAASPLLRLAIQRFKYARVRKLGDEFIAPMVDALSLLQLEDDSVLCPVPLHWSRKFQRGFNQADILARGVSDKSGVPVRHVLMRRKATGKQSLRDHEERKSALRNAFCVKGKTFPRHVILVDDVATTFSTLDACARELRSAGVERVDGLVIALG